MIEKNTDDMIMNFNVDLSSPVEVMEKPWNETKMKEIRKFTQPYFLVSANVNIYQTKQLTFTGVLIIVDVLPTISDEKQISSDEDMHPKKDSKFQNLVNIRWNLDKKKKKKKKKNYESNQDGISY